MASFVETWLQSALGRYPLNGLGNAVLQEIVRSTDADILSEELLLRRLESLADTLPNPTQGDYESG